MIYSDFFPYHISARSNNRDWFDVEMSYCYGVFINVLDECVKRFNFQIHTFVLMSNHFHLIATTPQKNIGEVLRYLMTQTSRGIGAKSQRINHIYGGRNHKQLILESAYYAHCFKYVVRNPIAAGVCENVEDYRWSSISKTPSRMKSLITPPQPCLLDYIPGKKCELMRWLNTPLPKELTSQCQKALRRPNFEFKPSRRGQKRREPTNALHPQKVPGT